MSSKKIVLITGANQGIGFETVKALAASSHPYHILLCGRSLDRAKEAVASAKELFPNTSSDFTALQLDIADDASISRAFEQVQSTIGHIDTLINNAGASFDGDLAANRLTMRETWNKSWNVNVSGTQVTTHTLMPLLLKSDDPRLLFVTSGLSSLENASDPKNPFNKGDGATGWPKSAQGPSFTAYRSSKTGMNMMMVEWGRILKADGVKIWCISPGFLATGLGGDRDMLKKMGAGDPERGGTFIRDVVEGKRDEDVGKVVSSAGVQAW